jgi:LPXTG-motif cell wall-anchored protein
MKQIKKIMAVMMIMAVLATVSFPAFAADGDKNDSITVKGAKTGETYDLYKLFDLTVNDEAEPMAYSYTVNEYWEDFFAEGGDGAGLITVEDGYVTAIPDADAAALAKAAAAWTGKPEATQSVTVAEGDTVVVFSGLEDGYWLITSTLGTFAMTETTPDKVAVTVNEKNLEDTIEKEVKEDSSGKYGESNDAQIGDTVEFQSTVKIVKGTRNVVVHDKMTDGLTYTAGSVAIDGLTKGTEYTVNEPPADRDTFDIAFDQEWIDGLDFGDDGFKEFVITYTAVINENAVVTDEDVTAIVNQYNKTHVSFGDGTDSEEDSTTTTTHKFSVYKHATGSTDYLADAVFYLKKNDKVVKLVKLDYNNYRVSNGDEEGAVDTFTTVASGDIVIWGVDSDDDYKLEEITPPSGYNKLNAEVTVEVDADNVTRIDVENKSGNELPSTGGIGTTLFYVIGGIMLAGAVIILVARRRAGQQ